MRWPMHDGWMGAGWLAMTLFWLLVLAAAIVLVRWLVINAGGTSARSRRTPLEILQARYARGEIGRDEYEEKRRDLGGE